MHSGQSMITNKHTLATLTACIVVSISRIHLVCFLREILRTIILTHLTQCWQPPAIVTACSCMLPSMILFRLPFPPILICMWTVLCCLFSSLLVTVTLCQNGHHLACGVHSCLTPHSVNAFDVVIWWCVLPPSVITHLSANRPGIRSGIIVCTESINPLLPTDSCTFVTQILIYISILHSSANHVVSYGFMRK